MSKSHKTNTSNAQKFPYNRNNASLSIIMGGILVTCLMYFIARNPAAFFYIIPLAVAMIFGVYHVIKGLINLLHYIEHDALHRQEYRVALFASVLTVLLIVVLAVIAVSIKGSYLL